MISEKTVELNLTTEFINWLSHQHNTPYFALGPTQAQEAQWGFDAGVFGNSTGALIQYKRAYVNGSVWEWRLNRTKAKDQLFRLQQLEAAGHAVFYAFLTSTHLANCKLIVVGFCSTHSGSSHRRSCRPEDLTDTMRYATIRRQRSGLFTPKRALRCRRP